MPDVGVAAWDSLSLADQRYILGLYAIRNWHDLTAAERKTWAMVEYALGRLDINAAIAYARERMRVRAGTDES